MPERPPAAFLGQPGNIENVYGPQQQRRLRERVALLEGVLTPETLPHRLDELEAVPYLFSTWGMFVPGEAALERMANLEAVFYAAGSVQNFARPFLERGVRVVSAWQLNGRPVAEFTLAQILLGGKGYFRNLRESSTPEGRRAGPFRGEGNYGRTLALLGAGTIGRQVIELIAPFDFHILVFDPFLETAEAEALGVEKVTLEAAFEHAGIVSNHLARKPETRGLVTGELLRRMPEHGVFINTGRGATVDERGLAEVMRERPDLTALLDVTDPEPPEDDSPFYALPNVLISSHIAGSIGHEVRRMADGMIDAFDAYRAARPVPGEIALEQLAALA